MRIILTFSLLLSIYSNAQVEPSKLLGFFEELSYYNADFKQAVADAWDSSNSIFTDREFPKEEIENEKQNALTAVKDEKERIAQEIEGYKRQIEASRKEIMKPAPFIPNKGKQMIAVYDQSLIYLENIRTSFESKTTKYIQDLESGFAQRKMDEKLGNVLLFPNNESFKSFLEYLQSDKLDDAFNAVFYENSYKNQLKLMKKYKLDSLYDFHSSETSSLHRVRNAKTGKIGLFEVSHRFNPKTIQVVLSPEFDSIQSDRTFGDYGAIFWTMAIGWKNGKPTVVEKKFEEDPDDTENEYRYERSYELKEYEPLNSGIWLPEMNQLTFGIAASKDSSGQFYYLDVDKDSILTPKYDIENYLPLIIDGEFNFQKRVKLATGKIWYGNLDGLDSQPFIYKISYQGKNTVDRYTEGNVYRRFHRNGKLMMEEQRVPRKETYDGKIIIYDREGNLYGKGFLNDKEVVEFDFFYQEGEKRRHILIEDSILSDTIYYPDGSFHSYGRQLVPGNVGGITIDYYEGLGVSRPIFYFQDHHKDSTWKYFYASKTLRAKGNFKKDLKVGIWEYYNPLGIKTIDDRYKIFPNTEMIFPFRLSRKDSIKGFYSEKYNRAILYDLQYDPPIFELWDLERNKQLKPPFNVPLHIPYTNHGFVGKNRLVGGSFDGDVPDCYDFDREEIIPCPDNYNSAENERIYSSKSRFNMKRKLDIRKVQFNDSKLMISSDSGQVYFFDLSTGGFHLRDKEIDRIDLDTIIERAYENQINYYVNYLPENGNVITYTGSENYEVVEVKNTPFGRTIELYYNYGIGRLSFQNQLKDKLLESFVKLEVNEDGEYIFYSFDNYYMGSKNLKDLVFFKQGEKYYDFEQFDLKYNRPDIILDRLGYADSSLVQAYHRAYQKRLKKMGFTEEMLKDDFHIPEIKIENFEEMPTITGENQIELNLKMKDDLYKLDRINIWINDVAVYGSNGISLRNKNVKEYAQKIKLGLAKGNNKIQVSVLNQAGAESYKETMEIECTKGKAKPDLYLITIGVSEFQQKDYNLTYAGKDAQDIAQLFEKNKVFEQVHSKVLTNQQVTKENIQGLKTFLKSAEINDEVMIFIAGHGVLDEELDYYFASYDMDFQKPAEKGIAYSDLEALLDGIKPLKKTLLIDACHSGEIDKEEVELIANTTKQEGDIQFRAVGKAAAPKLGMQSTSELSKSLFTDLRKGTGATVISSAGGMEFAMEGADWNNGLFTYCLLNGIRSKEADLNQDKEIWLSELQQYIQQKVFELSKGQQKPTSRIENQTVDFRVW